MAEHQPCKAAETTPDHTNTGVSMGKGSTSWPRSGPGAEGTSRGGGIVLSNVRRAEVRRLRMGTGPSACPLDREQRERDIRV